MHQQVGDFLELGVVGEFKDVVAAVVQVVAAATDGAQRRVAGGDAGQGDGFFGFGRVGIRFGRACFSGAHLLFSLANSESSFCS